MNARFQFARLATANLLRPGRALILLLVVFAIWPMATLAIDAPPGALGRVDGRDVSVEGGMSGLNDGDSTAMTGRYVSSGSVITVHSAKARMTIFSGGKVDICGPAQFTVLLSSDAITLALNFGRVRVDLPAKTTLRIFTPTIIGTPLDISGGSRDVTVGLNLDDSLCVLATTGAVQLEHQFTGEKLIVPEAGEFYLNAGRLLPIAGTPGTCACVADELQPIPPPAMPPVEHAAVIPLMPPVNSNPVPAVAQPIPDSAPPLAVQPSVEYSMLAHGNDEHPTVPDDKQKAPGAPPVTVPAYTVVLPPLTFAAGGPAPPPTTEADMVLLVREAQVSPEWEFSGHVNAPEFATALQSALGEGKQTNAKPEAQTTTSDQPEQMPKKKRGFWGSLKRIFGG